MVLCFISACGNKKTSIKRYYFPYKDFFTAKVYKYVNAKDSTKFAYWRFETGAKNGDTVLTTGIYDSQLHLTTAYHNGITDEGSRLRMMFVNLGDSVNMYQCEVKKNESFNWIIDPKTAWFVSFRMQNGNGLESREIVSERNVAPKKEKLTFDGETYECLVVKETTLINLVTNNRTKTEEQLRTSYFADGIGLVQFETFYADGTSELYKLESIIVDKDEKMFVKEKTDSTAAIQ
jgi:hypothetical protein